MQQAYQYLSLLEEKRGNPVKALDYFHTAMIYKDSILNEKAQRSITLLQRCTKPIGPKKKINFCAKIKKFRKKRYDDRVL